MSTETDFTETERVDLDQIIRDLNEGTGSLPEAALLAAREHRDAIIPRLIDVIRSATDKLRNGEKSDGSAPFFALFLLTEFRAQAAMPAIIEAVSLPGDIPYELFGDALYEILPRTFATLTDCDVERIDELIGDRSLSHRARRCAVDALAYLVRDGMLSHAEAVARLQRHLQVANREQDSELVTDLVGSLYDFSPAEAIDDIKEALRLGLVDEVMIDLDDIERSIRGGSAWVQDLLDRLAPTILPDSIAELKQWHSFAEPQVRPPDDFPSVGQAITEDWDIDEDLSEFLPRPAGNTGSHTIRDTQPRVGRNKPCPCGSGKKYKKCCGKTK